MVCEEHDWRVDPFVLLVSNPPQQRLVCAKCGSRSSRVASGWDKVPNSRDPADWGKAR